MNRNIVLKEFEEAQIAKLTNEKKISNFFPGDTVSVKLKIGDRFSQYEGVCIAKKNRGLNSAFTLRKISYGEGTERNFPFYSPNITEINLVRRGRVKRAKLYYLRALRGKNSRIKDSTTGYKMKLDTK